MIRSGRSCTATSYASSPSRAVSTRNPALRNLSDTTCRMCDSSSATKMVFPVIASSRSLSKLPRSILPPSPKSLTQVQLEPETTTLPHFALDDHPPVVHRLHDVLHERQAQPRALGHAVVRLGPVELVE